MKKINPEEKERPKLEEQPKENRPYESKGSDRLHSSLSEDCVTKLDNIIAQRARENEKQSKKKKTVLVTTEAKEIEKKNSDSKERRSILKSFSGKHVNSGDSSILIKETEECQTKIPLVTTKVDNSKQKPNDSNSE